MITERREAAGLTQREVWTAAGMPKNSYVRLEWNESEWRINALDRVCQVLGVSIVDVLREAIDLADRDNPGGGPWLAALGGE
ncbi:helix-turn-helix transcriptional regulator [Nocardia farcinica]|uniref:HTH cro/C1-type domain-containing protein n=1 Tax=Nocardia farcinica TaxID=37329 RepID=A0A0H5PAP5_NOCFR|nr:helix-turn-helix transcriptional regulator [Nocardia farcinica]SLG32483.1 Uncharacterised protein [Mycobacteroides abscessus subsp. abscessus]MBF6393845.1 helix-turn-helix transcriptional regulator [Nocardia farcinica]MBF6540792.1 helix-turn-helix transcriptional regulator [Nocardia farcinica]PFW98826.1 hypothetical protein CJ469_05787 [Nocardia farcinica]PFX04432.1 hypothetical protein CJ468_05408 [Nocardia farcinica]